MFSVYKLIFRKLILQVFEHMIWQTVICGICATGGLQKRNSKGLGKPSRHRKREQKTMSPIHGAWVGRHAGDRLLEMTHYSSSYVLQWALLKDSCHPKACAWKLQMPGISCSCIVPGCSPSQDLPAHSRLLPGSGRCAFATGCRETAKAPASTRAGGFVQGSGEVEFIYTPLSTCFLTSAAPLWALAHTCLYEPGYCMWARVYCSS